MVFPLAAAIGAGANLLGGILGQKSQSDMAAQNIAMQKQFAKKAIQWKVADSLKAGVHPLFGLGAQTHSFAPVSVGDSIGPAIANMGQDISRGISATSTPEQRVGAQLATLQLDRAGLENELLRSQIRQINSAGNPPGMPSGNATALATPTGDMVLVGPGSQAQAIADEYGDGVSEVEGGWRYIRDRVPTLGGMSNKWLSVKSPFLNFEW